MITEDLQFSTFIPSIIAQVEFVGASYRKAGVDSTDSVSYDCKNKKLTRRNRKECRGLVKFRMLEEEDAFEADTDDLIEYTPHGDW